MVCSGLSPRAAPPFYLYASRASLSHHSLALHFPLLTRAARVIRRDPGHPPPPQFPPGEIGPWYLPREHRQPVPAVSPDWASAARHPKGCPTENPSPTRKGLVLRRLPDLDKGTKTTRRGGGSSGPVLPDPILCVVTLPFQALRREWGWGRATGESESYTCPRGHVVTISEGEKSSVVRASRHFASGL